MSQIRQKLSESPGSTEKNRQLSILIMSFYELNDSWLFCSEVEHQFYEHLINQLYRFDFLVELMTLLKFKCTDVSKHQDIHQQCSWLHFGRGAFASDSWWSGWMGVEGHYNTFQEVLYLFNIFYVLLYTGTSKSKFFMQMSVCFRTGNVWPRK